jgi:hypothetical protein
MSQFLTAVFMVFVIGNFAFALWSYFSLRKLFKLKDAAKLEDKILLDHLVHTRSSLNLIYTSIATAAVLITFYGLNLKDKVSEELRAETTRTITEHFKSTPIQQASDTAAALLASIRSNASQSNDLLKLMQIQPKDLKLVTGSTPEDGSGWEKYRDGIMCRVNTGLDGLKYTPLYLASLYGNNEHASAVGVNAIYDASQKAFTVYVFQSTPGGTINPQKAMEFRWHVRWVAVMQ